LWALENRDEAGNRFTVERIEATDLDADRVQEVLILMRHEGTGGYLDWCLLARKAAGVGCWDAPDFEAPAARLLQADEDFGFHGWQLRALPGELRLTRSVYHKGVDPNCCPTRGAVVVSLVPGGAKLVLGRVTRAAPRPRVSK
jgi:hypothetical protein